MTVSNLPVREKHIENGTAHAWGTLNSSEISFGHRMRDYFFFDDDYVNLNHGSFGTYPSSVRDAFRSFQDKSEARPDPFIRYDYPRLVDKSRDAMAKFLNVPLDTVVFLQNATTGVNTVLRNLVFKSGDKIVYFEPIYGACEKTIQYITETTPAEAVRISYSYPVSDQWLVQKFRDVVEEEQKSGYTVRLAIFDTVVAMPGVRMPFERLTEACKDLGVLSCIDAAHGVGHIHIDLGKLDCDFFFSNCHKWLFVPRPCAVFYVPVRNQHLIRSTVPTSHGFTAMAGSDAARISPLPPSAKSYFVNNFEFVGTIDNASYLTIPTALAFRDAIGGEEAIRRYCFDLARKGGKRLAEILGTTVLENEESTLGECCFTNVRLPLDLAEVKEAVSKRHDGEQASDHGIEGKVIDFMSRSMIGKYNTFMALMFHGDSWWVRMGAQIYLEVADFEFAGEVLMKLSKAVMTGDFIK